MIPPPRKRIDHGITHWVYVARCDRCGRKVGGDFTSHERAQAAVDAHECEEGGA